MKKIMFLVLLLVSLEGVAQDFFVKTGINQATYKFKDSAGIPLDGLLPGVGNSYQLGFGLPLFDYWGQYEIGLTVDSYNASGGDSANSYSWNTSYGGIRNSFAFYPFDGEFILGILGSFGISKIISGSQTLNNAQYSLHNHPEFSGLMIQPGLGLSLSYNLLKKGYLSFEYDYSKTLRLKNNLEEKLSFNTHRILLGVHFRFD